MHIQFSSVAHHIQLFVTPWTAARQASLSITNSWNLFKLMSFESVMPSNHLILFSSCLRSFPASGSFQMNQFFASGGQSIGVSASTSVLPVVTCGCESWTVKEAERQRIDAFELWCWRRFLRISWTARRSNQSILRKSILNILWKD